MAFPRKVLLAGVSAALAITATSFSMAEADTGSAVSTVESADIPVPMEDFNYPGASKIQAETSVVLKHGNGNLMLVACDNSEDIRVLSRTGPKDFCFDVTIKPAYLTLEIPKAYGIWTSADPVKTTITNDGGATTVINAPANDFTGYGESGSGDVSTLIELRVDN